VRAVLALLAVVVLLGLGGAGAYLASPYETLRRLESAARAGDAGAVGALTDLPVVRANLSPAVGAALAGAEPAPVKKPSFFQRLRRIFSGPPKPGRPDALATPEALAALLRAVGPTIAHEGYLHGDLDAFEARLTEHRKGRALTLLLQRRGFLTWRVVGVELWAPPAPS
jgi:hypothetical protein